MNQFYARDAIFKLCSRWLLSKGKDNEVEKIYCKMARMNNLQVTDEAINIFKELNVAENKTVCLFFIFSRKHIRLQYISKMQIFIYIIISLTIVK